MKHLSFSRNAFRFCRSLLAGFPLVAACACTTTLPPQAGLNALKAPGMESPVKNRLAKLSPEELIYLGNGYLHKNAQLAMLHFAVALEKDPKSVPALVGIGKALFAKGEYAKARKAFATALKEEPGNLPSLLYTGKIDRRQGDFDAAQNSLSKAMEKDKDNSEVVTELAMTYDEIGQNSLAGTLYEKVIKLEPDLAAAYNNLGYNYLLQGRYAEAIPMFYRAYVIDPKDKTIQCNMGAAYALAGDEEKALRIFKTVVGEAGAYNNLGYFMMVKGDYSLAEKDFRQALQLKPELYLKANENLSRLERFKGGSKSIDTGEEGRISIQTGKGQ